VSAQLDAQLLGDAELQPLPGLQVFQTLQSACCSGILSYATYFDAQLPGGARLLLLLDLQGHLAVLLFRKSHRWWQLLHVSVPATTQLLSTSFAQACVAAGCVQALAEAVKSSADVVWPVVHGAWGEGGQLQAALEAADVPFVGTPVAAADEATHKLRCAPTADVGCLMRVAATNCEGVAPAGLRRLLTQSFSFAM